MGYIARYGLLSVLGAIKLRDKLLAWDEKTKLEGELAAVTVEALELKERTIDVEIAMKEAEEALSLELANHEAIMGSLTSSLNKVVDELLRVKVELDVAM